MNNEMEIPSTPCECAGEEVLIKAAERASAALDVAIDVMADIQKIISGSRPKMMRIRLGDKTLAEFPLALTAAAAFTAGLAAVLLTKLAIEIDHED